MRKLIAAALSLAAILGLALAARHGPLAQPSQVQAASATAPAGSTVAASAEEAALDRALIELRERIQQSTQTSTISPQERKVQR